MIVYDNTIWAKRGVLFRWNGSVIPNALLVAVPSALLSVIIMFFYSDADDEASFRNSVGADTLKSSQLWAALTAAIAFLVGFRTHKAYQRFWDGTTLLNQMWGEWFDAASCLFAFSHLARHAHPAEVKDFRHTLVRLMSLCHGSALEEISLSDNDPQGYPCLDIGGLDLLTLKWLRDCKFNQELKFNRVEVIIHMIQNLIVENQEKGVLKIPPPILSRVFQTISRGQVNLANCKKIVYTLFPLPYAQVISVMLIVLNVMTPLVMASILEKAHYAFIFTVIPVFGLNAMNLVAIELEMPFGKDDNDLPLDEFQDHMNNSMLMLICDESDIVPHINRFAGQDFYAIKARICKQRPKDLIDELERKERGFSDDTDSTATVQPQVPPEKGDKDCALPMEVSIVAQSAQKKTESTSVPSGQLLGISDHPILLGTSNLPASVAPDPTSQNKIEVLTNAFAELKVNTNSLSSHLRESMKTFHDLTTCMSVFSSQLGQSSEAMVAFLQHQQKQVPAQKPPETCWWTPSVPRVTCPI